MYADQTFYAKVYLRAPLLVTGECLAKYRQHADSTVHSIKKLGNYHSARLFYFNWLMQYLSEQCVKDAEVWQSLQDALKPYRHPKLYRLERYAKRLIQRIIVLLHTLKRLAMLRSIGSIRSNPNPVFVPNDIYGVTTLSWTSKGTETVEVHVDAPDGPLSSRTGPSGNYTLDWVNDGKVFYLQDVSGGIQLVPSSTLATVTVHVIPAENPLPKL